MCIGYLGNKTDKKYTVLAHASVECSHADEHSTFYVTEIALRTRSAYALYVDSWRAADAAH
ncbi:MAG: hypothetical protein NVSMB44_15250 [Ktedonobacteraceae bacterium]